MDIGVEYVRYYVPDSSISVVEYFQRIRDEYQYSIQNNKLNAFIKESGYDRIVIEKQKSRIEMISALFALVKQDGYPLEEIDTVIYTADIPESIKHKVVYQIKLLHDFNMNKTNYFTMNQQCGTQLNGLSIAESLIRTNKAQKVMVVSHSYKDNMLARLIEGYGVTGDGAAVAIVSNGCAKRIIMGMHTEVSNQYYDLKMTPKEGLAYLDYLQHGIASVQELLKKTINLEEIKMIIPQNVNKMEWLYCSKRLNFNLENVFLENIGKYGHLGDADAIVNMKDATEHRLQIGDYFILQSVGAGATFNSMLMKC